MIFPRFAQVKILIYSGKRHPNDIGGIRAAMSSIADIELKDGVTFDADHLAVDRITEDAEYGGLRIKIWPTVGGDRQRLQLDIDFDDKIVGGPVTMNYPSMLDFPSPEIKVYSLESALAEKLEAIVSLGALSSRMKDYFDVWFIFRHHNINTGRLQEAIETTFNKRHTPLSDSQYVFDEAFKNDETKQQQQWQAFLNRSSIDVSYSFGEIVTIIEEYINSFLLFEE